MNVVTGKSGTNYFLDKCGELFRFGADRKSVDQVTDPSEIEDANQGTLVDLSGSGDARQNTPSGDDSIGPPGAKSCGGRTGENEDYDFDFAPTRRAAKSVQPAPAPVASEPAAAAPAPAAAPVEPAPVRAAQSNPPPGGDAGFDTSAQTKAYSEEETAAFGKKMVTHLQKELGITENQAKGIVANLMHESAGLNPGMNQGMHVGEPSKNMADDNANGFGLAQWGGVRKQALIKLADDQGIPASSQKANVDYLVKELKEPGALDALKRTGSTEEATESFCNTFERPSDPQMASRLDYARKLG